MIQLPYVINLIIRRERRVKPRVMVAVLVSVTIECINRLNSFPGMTREELCETMKKASRINYPYNCSYNCLICNNTDQETRTKRFVSQIMNSLDKWHTWLTSVKDTSRMLLVTKCRTDVGKSLLQAVLVSVVVTFGISCWGWFYFLLTKTSWSLLTKL